MYSAESKEISDLLSSKISTQITRVQTYQQAETPGVILPGSLIRFNIPASDIIDFRDSYVELDLQLLNTVEVVNEVVVYTSEDVAGVPSSPISGAFRLEYRGYTTPSLAFGETNANILAALEAMPSIIEDGLVGFITVVNDLAGATNTLTFTNSSLGFRWNENNVRINMVNESMTDGVILLLTPYTITANGATQFPLLEYGIGSIIDKVTIEINAETCQEIEHYYLLWNIASRLKLADSRNSDGMNLTNEGKEETFAFTGARRFAIPLYGVGLLNHVIPLSLVQGIQFRVTLYLANPRIALIADAANSNASYQVSRCRFNYHRVTYPYDTMIKLQAALDSDYGLRYGFDNWLDFNNTITGSTSDIILNFNVRRFLGVVAVMRQQDFYNDFTSAFKNCSFIRNDIQSYRLKIGNVYFPTDRVDLLQANEDITEPYIELLRFFNLYRPITIDANVNQETLAGYNYAADLHTDIRYETNGRKNLPSFMIAISTDSTARDCDGDNHCHSSGINTSGQVNITLELRNYTLQSDNTITVFGKFTGVAVFKSGQFRYEK